MKVLMKNGKQMEIREAVENNVTYMSHYDLKTLAVNDGTMFDFPHVSTVNTGTFSSVMCVVSSMDGKRSYGTGQAQTLKWATDMAFDNAMIDLYQINGKSSVELEILKKLKADQEKASKAAEKKATEEKAAKEAQEKAAKEAQEKAAKEAQEKAAKEAQEKAAKEKAAKEAQEKAAKEAQEKAAKEKAAKEAQEKAAKEAQEKAAKEAQEKKAAEEAKAAQESAAKGSTSAVPAYGRTGYWYENEPDWTGCHSLTPEDPDDTVINYGPFKQTTQPTELKPGPKYLSQVLKYRADYVESLLRIQPPNFMSKIPQFLTYCNRHGIGLHAANSKAREMMQKYGVKELA